MIDTHAHLNFQEFEGKTDEIVGQSRKVGLTGIILASADVASSKKSIVTILSSDSPPGRNLLPRLYSFNSD